jgi:hypothetical protein
MGEAADDGTSTQTSSRPSHHQREPPSLQKLVEDHAGYDKITPEAWAEFDAAMALWKEFVRAGGLHRS